MTIGSLGPMRRVAIIGGGFSGAAAAILLSRAAARPLELTVIEPRAQVGGGLAHSTTHPVHRLNAPDTVHSIYVDDPLHFADWMRRSGALAADPQALIDGRVFPRRRDFGRYMAGEFERHRASNPSGSRIGHLRRRALRIQRMPGSVRVLFDDGDGLEAAVCLLATGWSAAGIPAPLAAVTAHPAWLGEPWNDARMASIAPDAPVLLIGAGLTAADAFCTLAAGGHRGLVHALSRHGLRPAAQNPHQSSGSVWQGLLDPEPAFMQRHGHLRTVRAVLYALRHDIAATDPADATWHTAFDQMRDAALHFWPALAPGEKRRFVRHLKSWHDARRFRNPPQVERVVARAVSDGRLRFVAGRLCAVRPVGDEVEIGFAERGTARTGQLRVRAILNCTGPAPRPSQADNPLWRALIDDGLARDHDSGLGVDVDIGSRLIAADGRIDPVMFAIGPAAMGALGETIAVPFIARQILGIAGMWQ